MDRLWERVKNFIRCYHCLYKELKRRGVKNWKENNLKDIEERKRILSRIKKEIDKKEKSKLRIAIGIV